MRALTIFGAAAAAMMLASSGAEAARWCHGPAGAQNCGYRSKVACQRAAGGRCYQRVARRAAPAPRASYGSAAPAVVAVPRAGYGMPGQIYPNRPYWASPYECYTDEGNGRFNQCNSAGPTP